MSANPKPLNNAQIERGNLLVASISVTGSALVALSNAEITGAAVQTDTVTSVSRDLEAMIAELRSILAPK